MALETYKVTGPFFFSEVFPSPGQVSNNQGVFTFCNRWDTICWENHICYRLALMKICNYYTCGDSRLLLSLIYWLTINPGKAEMPLGVLPLFERSISQFGIQRPCTLMNQLSRIENNCLCGKAGNFMEVMLMWSGNGKGQ